MKTVSESNLNMKYFMKIIIKLALSVLLYALHRF